MDIRDKIIQNIKDKEIKPTPRIYFISKNILFWSFWALSVFVGSMAVSAIIFLMQVNDWGMYRYVSNTFPGFILKTLPYFWIVLFLLFIAVGYFAFRNVKGAYKYKIKKIILATLILSIIFGIGFSQARMGKMLDHMMGERMPMYRQMRINHMRMWDRPDRGVIVGEVYEIEDEYFVLRCGCDRKWNVYGKKAEINANVKVFGEKINQSDFEAREILLIEFMPKTHCERKVRGMRTNK